MAQTPDRGLMPEDQAFDTGRSEQLVHVRYEDLLRALGGYIDQQGLTDVLITQIPDGVLLKGTAVEQRLRGVAVERITSVLFTNEDVVMLLEESFRKRGNTDAFRPGGSS